MAAEIFIARHGQNEDNAEGILNGHRDRPLTTLGRKQAEDLGEGIKGLHLNFEAVFTSPLSRAYETATIVSHIAELPKPEILTDLIEREFGVMTGKRVIDVEKLCAPNVIKTNTITYFLNPEGAESFDQLMIRGQDILNIIRSRVTKGRVLLVCHGDIGKMIYAVAAKASWQDVLVNFHFGNGDLIDVTSQDSVHVIKLPQYNH